MKGGNKKKMEQYSCYGNCDCGSGSGEYSGRAFLTKEEKVNKLKEYKKALETEAKAVSEKIADIEAKGK